ncbi:hypothetical protein [Kaistella yonginensis]|uniref:hypothetical protein n=1 Tax=Kaistella yonginensis TaxID=658267 RepID=UPI0025B45B57|nr:hypothetical protein [Kaistella yonginensis]MDN3607304.1 hypothetical protein [Kaistella yonginensis]
MIYRTLAICKIGFGLFIKTQEKIIFLNPHLEEDFKVLRNDYNLLGVTINNYLKWGRINWIDEEENFSKILIQPETPK